MRLMKGGSGSFAHAQYLTILKQQSFTAKALVIPHPPMHPLSNNGPGWSASPSTPWGVM